LPTWSLAPVLDAVPAMRGVGFIVAVTGVVAHGRAISVFHPS